MYDFGASVAHSVFVSVVGRNVCDVVSCLMIWIDVDAAALMSTLVGVRGLRPSASVLQLVIKAVQVLETVLEWAWV